MIQSLRRILEKQLFSAGLNSSIRRDLLHLFNPTSEDQLRYLVNLFDEYPESVQILAKFYWLKAKTLNEVNPLAWRRVIAEERAALQELGG